MRSVDPGITSRVRRRVRADFGDDADLAMRLLADVESGNQDRERVVAAVLLGARGDLQRLRRVIELSRFDWRDVLVGAGLGNADWARVILEQLGPVD